MARRDDEKTVKITADTKDLQESFDDLQDAYAKVAKSSEEYANAVDASARAVTEAEKKAALEVEKAHKKVLDSDKKRLSALKTRDGALQSSHKAITGVTKAEGKQTEASDKGSKAARLKGAAMAGAALAVTGLAMAMGKAIEISKEMLSDMIATSRQGSENRAKLIALEDTYKSLDKTTKELKQQITLIVAEFAIFGRLIDTSGPVGTALTWLKNEIVWLYEHGMMMAKVFGTMAVNFESFGDAAKRIKDVNAGLKDLEKTRDKDKAAELQVKKNIEERVKAMEAAQEREKALEEQRKANAKAATERAKAKAKEDEESAIADAEALRAHEEAAEAYNQSVIAEKYAEDQKRQVQILVDESLQRMEDELALRQELDRQKTEAADGDLEQLALLQEYEQELFDIRKSGMSWEAKARAEKLLQLKFVDKQRKKNDKDEGEENKKRMAEIKAATDATVALGASVLEQAGMKNAAVALESGKKAAYYYGEAYGAFAGGNIISGAGYLAAAAQHTIVAGGAAVGGFKGGGAPAKGGSTMAGSSPSSPSNIGVSGSGGGTQNITTVVNIHTVTGISNEDAKRIEEATTRASKMRVGGSK